MKNKHGFTLVELLAVIVILSLLVTIAVPSTIAVSNKIKKNMYCSKIDLIETAALLYGEDQRNNIESNGTVSINVKTLVNTKYLKKDQKSGSTSIIDPRNNQSMDNMNLTLGIKNNRVVVNFDSTVNDVCDKTPIYDTSDGKIYTIDDLKLEQISNNYYFIDNTENFVYVSGRSPAITINKFKATPEGTKIEMVNGTIKLTYQNGDKTLTKQYNIMTFSTGIETEWRNVGSEKILYVIDERYCNIVNYTKVLRCDKCNVRIEVMRGASPDAYYDSNVCSNDTQLTEVPETDDVTNYLYVEYGNNKTLEIIPFKAR